MAEKLADMVNLKSLAMNKQRQVVVFSATAIALYGFDQGQMSLINTNYDYLSTMGIAEESPLVGVIVSIYYLGCALGAVMFSWLADNYGRRPSLLACLATASLGNLLMFVSGLGYSTGALAVMLTGRVVMGLGVGGIDSVVPVFSSELSEDDARGKALAQEFQSNILGLNIAFALNLGLTVTLGKHNQWAWRIPVIAMQIYPVMLIAFIRTLPESPIWLVHHNRNDDAKKALMSIYGQDEGDKKADELIDASDDSEQNVTYTDMLSPDHDQFHPTIITIMGQVCQALTGYGAVSVYGPQIFELLGFDVRTSEYLTQGNYISYLLLMTFAWLLIDAIGRRPLLLGGSLVLTICFVLLALFGGLVQQVIAGNLDIPRLAVAVPGIVTLFIATGAFGVGYLTIPWLVGTEIYPTAARAQGTAVSVIIWGLANFAVTLATPIMFNNLGFWLFAVFAGTNLVAGLWVYLYHPESGGRSFDENRTFFDEAKKARTWRVNAVKEGEFKRMPYGNSEDDEETPLLRRVADQVR